MPQTVRKLGVRYNRATGITREGNAILKPERRWLRLRLFGIEAEKCNNVLPDFERSVIPDIEFYSGVPDSVGTVMAIASTTLLIGDNPNLTRSRGIRSLPAGSQYGPATLRLVYSPSLGMIPAAMAAP